MKMKKILLASGCSFTDENFESPVHPEMDTSWPKWPELLANKLDMKCINLAMNGGGNEYIYSSLLDQILKTKDKSQIGLVIPAWTQCQRKDYQLYAVGYWRSERFDPHGEVFGWVRKSLRYMISLQIVCERYNIPLKQFQMLNLFDGWIHGLQKTDAERIKNKDNPDFIPTYKYQGLNPKKDQAKCQQLMLSYDSYINAENFLGWPTLKIFGGFNVEEETLKAACLC